MPSPAPGYDLSSRLICYETVIVELKALARLSTLEQAQILNYLKATRLKTGLLLNFGVISLEYKRFVHSKNELRIAHKVI